MLRTTDRKCPRNGRNACKQQLPKPSEMKAKSGEKNKTENDHKRVFSDTKYACSIFFPSLLKIKIKTLTLFMWNVCNCCVNERSSDLTSSLTKFECPGKIFIYGKSNLAFNAILD